MQRKTLIALTTVHTPEELQTATANVWAAYLAVRAGARVRRPIV